MAATNSDTRFPESASLFQFCREVLQVRRSLPRVLDQDIGGLLALDPADCSHWKRGRKQIRSIQAIETLAVALECDSNLVAGVATGQIDVAEAVLEVKGYGPFGIDQVFVNDTLRELQRHHPEQWSRDRERCIRDACEIDIGAIKELVKVIHERIGCCEAPVFIPELINGLSVMPKVDLPEIPAGKESRPWFRFNAARAIGDQWLRGSSVTVPATGKFPESVSIEFNIDGRSSLPAPLAIHVREVELNQFALELLAPLSLVKAEVERCDTSQDLVDQLSESFWLSRSVMNRRIRDAIAASF